MAEPSALFQQLWERFGREVSVSFVGDSHYPWSVMVEGDRGSFAGTTLEDALEYRLESEPPEFETGFGVDAR